eukprot:1234882-Pyramimonas_sp.AAC.1
MFRIPGLPVPSHNTFPHELRSLASGALDRQLRPRYLHQLGLGNTCPGSIAWRQVAESSGSVASGDGI